MGYSQAGCAKPVVSEALPLLDISAGGGPGVVYTPACLADVAQLVEHFTRNEGVSGSSPLVGSLEAPQMQGL